MDGYVSKRAVIMPPQKLLCRYLTGEIGTLEPELQHDFERRFGVSFRQCGREEVARRLGGAVREGRLVLAQGTRDCLRERFGVEL